MDAAPGAVGNEESARIAPGAFEGAFAPLTFPACAVHSVPVKLRRLVEGISSGPSDSREHRRELFLVRRHAHHYGNGRAANPRRSPSNAAGRRNVAPLNA